MALSTGSKILVNDISTALAGKQNVLGYTPVKSVNGTLADSAGNVSISVSAPVTSVNGMTGAVTINVAGTKVNNAVTADKATTTPNVAFAWQNSYSNVACSGGSASGSNWILPSGGTWRYLRINGDTTDINTGGTASGNSNIALKSNGTIADFIIAIRIS